MRRTLHWECSKLMPRTTGALLIGMLGIVVAGCSNAEDNNMDAKSMRLGTPCTNDAACAPGVSCIDGVCCGPCQGLCLACTAEKKGHGVDGECGVIVAGTDPDNECPGHQVCHGDESCSGSLRLGSPCSNNNECWSSNCIDGVCCNEFCSGRCRACTAAKKGDGEDGICGAIGAGTDPDDDCTAECDRSGACMPIVNGNPCRFNGECVSGHCVDGICCNTTCDDLCMDCRSERKGSGINGVCGPIALGSDPDNECIGNVACSGTGACSFFVNGAACGMSAECESTICSDGICCNTSCFDSCVTCGFPGTEGTCMETAPNACPAICEGPVEFKDARSLPTGFVKAISVADLNSDGMPDLIVGNAQTHTLDVYLRTGDKAFGPPTGYIDIFATSIAVADFNTDGYPDLATTNTSMAGHLNVLLNQGNGTFGTTVDCPALGIPIALVAADLNGDGKPDLAGAMGNSFGVSVSLNNGNGTFAMPVNYPAGPHPRVIVAADFNGDGHMDLATGNEPGSAHMLINNGNGTFATDIALPTPGTAVADIVATDVNADGKPDLVVAYGRLGVLLNSGNGAFGVGIEYPPSLDNIVATDFNGDGKIDIAGVSHYLDATGVVLNRGDGTFEPVSYYDPSNDPIAIAAGDLNDDGSADLVVGNDLFGNGQPVVSILENEGPGTFMAPQIYPLDTKSANVSATTADVTGDGKVDVIVAGADANALQIFQANGSGVLTSSVPISLPGTKLLNVTTLDVDGDGDQDIAALKDGATHTLVIFLNNGSGLFDPMIESPLILSAIDMVAIELNGDGRKDLALIANAPPQTELRTYLSQGNGTFVKNNALAFDGEGIAIGAADLNGNGREDLVTIGYNNGPPYAHVFMNKGNGQFESAVDYPVGEFRHDLAMADLTGDGFPEMVLTSATEAKLNLLVNHGNGTFEPHIDFEVHAARNTLLLVDMTGDGERDIVVGSLVGHALEILVKDGMGSFAPRVEYPLPTTDFVPMRQWGILLAPGDFDGNGKMDLAVLSQFEQDDSKSILSVLLNRTVNACYPAP